MRISNKLAIFTVATLIATPAIVSQVNAGSKCYGNACKVFQSMQKTSVSGKSCVYMRQRDRSPLVATEGKYRQRNNAQVLGKFSDSGWKSVGNGVYQKKICINKSKMAKVRTFTICGSVGHYTFNVSETNQFKRQSGALGRNDIARMWSGG